MMKNLRLLAVSAALATGALAAAAIPAFATTTAPRAAAAAEDTPTLPVPTQTAPATTTGPGPAAFLGVIGTFRVVCVSDLGTVYSVNANGISIKITPGGSTLKGIPEGTLWDDHFFLDTYSSVYTCGSLDIVNGQSWLPGRILGTNVNGWVGAEYLDYAGPFS